MGFVSYLIPVEKSRANRRRVGHETDGSFRCDEESPCRKFSISNLDFQQKHDEWGCHHDSEIPQCCSFISDSEVLDVAPNGLTECFHKSFDDPDASVGGPGLEQGRVVDRRWGFPSPSAIERR